MAKYISTGKFNFGKTLFGLILGIGAGVLIGLLYGWAIDIIPLIIADMLVIVLVLALLGAVETAVVRFGSIRNKPVKIVTAIIICLTAWYSQWVFITQTDFMSDFFHFDRVFRDIIDFSDIRTLSFSRASSGSGAGISGTPLMIMYGLEFIMFLIPIGLTFKMQKEYYCETCGVFNANDEYFVRNGDETRIPSAEQSGDFRFLNDLPWHKTADSIGNAWKVGFSYCPRCRKNGVIDISAGRLEANRKGKIQFKKDRALINATLVSDLATDALISKTPTAQQHA